ncbi:MAG: hypothetical protein OXT05_02485 [Chloroflexota bacterium]|nr:hypothetical protein [Chloroflexota bacterium]
MIERPAPQDYLDDLHAIGVTRLFQPHLSTRDRAAGIRRVRQELGRIRTELTFQRDGMDDGLASSAEEAKRRAAPLNLLLLLHEQLVEEVGDLERSLSNGKPLPYSFDFGRFIFGDEATGEWFVGGQEQYDDWLKIQQFKKRLDALRMKGQPAREQLNGVREELEALSAKRDKAQASIDGRKKRSFVLRRIGMLVILIAASGTVGAHYWNSYRDFSLVALGLAAACALLIPIVIVNWKNPRTRTARRQRKLEQQILELKQEGLQYRQSYQPLELQIKALEVHYSRMMDTWEAARLVKNRLDSFIEEGQPLRERVESIRAELEALRPQRDKLLRKLESRQKRGAFPRRMILHIMMVLASGAVGFYFQYTGQPDYASVIYGLGAFCILLVPLAYIDWKNRNYKLESNLRKLETRMLQLQTEGKQVMKRYHPIELQIKTLIAQYKRTRAGIRNSQESSIPA